MEIPRTSIRRPDSPRRITKSAAPYSARFVTNPCFAAHRLTSCFWIASAQQLLAGGTAVWRERQDLLFGKLHICYAGSLEK
ncbi:hypothetical protein [Cupriavidus sp. UME77]|uniref:hypothetical protein n=1 Tax=Cupriavidus sp. UME77 TaxID=1862321 RepID=UPI0015FEC620|nr:hypothetical protein [Cupriavidus sp. UME77]